MRIATWNIYWLGERTGEKIQRSESDYELIARAIRQLAPDVLALEEIVDPLVMETILKLVNADGFDYTIRSGSDWLTSDPHPTDQGSNLQKPFICINNKTVEVVKGSTIFGGPSGRRPYALKLRERSSGKEFIAIGVHLRSGYPDFLDDGDADVRRKEVKGITAWLQGDGTTANHNYPRPDCDDVLLFGDFNAQMDDPNHSLDGLTSGNMAHWLWQKPAPDGNHWETALYEGDHFVIDFILLSESLKQKVVSGPKVYAWDFDPQMGGGTAFHVGPNGSGNLKGYGVSDHRPVFVDVEL